MTVIAELVEVEVERRQTVGAVCQHELLTVLLDLVPSQLCNLLRLVAMVH